MKNLTVSIIMATYNRAHFIEETILSIRNQSFSNWECLIIDDGSKDKTVEVLKPYLDKDDRFKYIERSTKYKKGLPGCRNMGLDLAKGDYIIFFDDDDIVHPQLIETCLNLFSKNAGNFCAYRKMPFSEKWTGAMPQISQNNEVRLIGLDNLEEILTGKLGLASCTVMWKKECFSNTRFNEELMYAEEWECYSRILISGHSGIYTNEILYYNRKHLKSNTGEFWSGDENKKMSKIDAANLIITNLKMQNLLSYRLMKFFTWESVRLGTPLIFDHLLKQKSINTFDSIKIKFYYFGSPLIKPWLRVKKKIKLRF